MNGQEDKEKEILVTWSSLPSYEEYIEMIKLIQDSAQLTSMGDFHKQLGKELKEYMETWNMVSFVNRCMALEMIIQALELTGEMTTTPSGFAPTIHAIVRNNLTLIFCDISPEDYTTDLGKIRVLTTDKTSTTTLVYVYGNLHDVERIKAITRKYGLRMIYDAAHTFGGQYKGKSVAEFGDASIFSFHATKVLNSIEGGMVTFKEDWMGRRLNCPKNFGIVSQDYVVWVGGNTKTNEFQVVMGLCNLRHLDREIRKRKKVVERYLSGLAGVSGIKLPSSKEGFIPNYAYLLVLLEGLKVDRDQVYDCLAGHRVHPRKYFYPLINDFQCYKGRFSSKDTPVATYVTDRVLMLPCYTDLILEDVNRIYGITRGAQETSMGKVLLMIPVLNEEKNMGRVVEDLARGFPYPNYVVVNDGSRDSTAKICRDKGYNLSDLSVSLGLAGCSQASMKYAYRKGYRYAIQFDGGGQHRPEYTEVMRQKMEEECDIAISSRFVTEKKGWSTRMIGGRVIGSATRLTTDTRVMDLTPGMRTFSRKVIGESAPNLNYGPELGTVSFLIKQGARAAELQATIDKRLEGGSYLKPLTAVHYMARMLTSILMIQSFRKRQYQDMFENCFSGIPGAWRTS